MIINMITNIGDHLEEEERKESLAITITTVIRTQIIDLIQIIPVQHHCHSDQKD